MSDFEQNGLWGLQKLVENDQSELHEQVKKKRQYLPRVLLLVFSAVIVIIIMHLFWPSVKGGGLMGKAAGLLNRDVSLTGIIYSEDNPMAIVNSKIVHEGDVVDEVKIVKIHKDSIDLERAERRWSQSLPTAEEGVHSGSSGLPVLLVLGSEGCAPCKKMKPILNKLKSKYSEKFQVKYIDVQANKAAEAKYGVKAVPTQIFYDSKGREVFRHVGFYSKKEILTAWRDIGIEL